MQALRQDFQTRRHSSAEEGSQKAGLPGLHADVYADLMPATLPHQRAIRILLADDHRLFAESLMALLSEDDRVEVVGIAANGAEAVELATELQPDAILMDVMMPLMDGLEATRRIRKRGLRSQIFILTGTEEPIGSEEAAEAGASGYLRKEQGIDELRTVLLEAASLAAVLGTPASS
jgi:two-component system, NarL family, response regulator LiaR